MTTIENTPGPGPSPDLLRPRREDSQQVTSIELFFDVVFVFAVTQLSHLLLFHLSLVGLAQTILLLLTVWQAWVDTAWVTNWFDPDRQAVRFMLIGVMLASLVMSVALPEAFTGRGLFFAGAYVSIQVGRTLFAVLALKNHRQLRRNFQRILAWCVLSGTLWIFGGVLGETARIVVWVLAVVVDVVAPAVGFFTPGLGHSKTTDWKISGSHMAERCRLFLIIALGESILVIGTTFSEAPSSVETVTALVVVFAGSIALWWIYFYRSAEYGREVISSAADPGRIARSAYTYYHLPMVAGIILTAVSDELTIAHPSEPAHTLVTAITLGGPLLYLVGHTLFKWSLSGRFIMSHLLGILILAVMVPVGLVVPMSTLVVGAAGTFVVVAVATWDTWRLWRGSAADLSSANSSMKE